MKLRNIINKGAMSLMLVAAMGVTSCNYLDVVPDEQVTIDDAMKTPTSVLGFLYSCYQPSLGSNGNEDYTDVPYGSYLKDCNAAADDMLNPDAWQSDSSTASSRYINYGTLSASANVNFWHYWYSGIGQCLLFQQKLEQFHDFLLEREICSQAEIDEYNAECWGLIAYYHYALLKRYGPIVILDHLPDMSISGADMAGRSHVDYVADWICQRLDECVAKLPSWRDTDGRGRMTKAACMAIKAKTRLLVASPLFNGSFPFESLKNENYETPGYGLELVSKTYDRNKYQLAYDAVDAAIKEAENDGQIELYRADRYLDEGINLDELYIPGGATDEFKAAVLRMRYIHYAMWGEGNHSFVWQTDSNGTQSFLWQAPLPQNFMQQTNGSVASGWNGLNPTLNMVEHFLTKDGYLPEHDPNYTPEDEWFQTAGLSGGADEGRERIINLCVGREPRFYAWVGFDGGDYGLRLKNGEPIHLNNISKTANGFNRSIRNNSITGFQSQKYIPPTARKNITDGSWVNFQWTARAIVRLAELYLIRAEAAAALGNDTQAMSDINVIRERAGAAPLTADHLTKMSMMEWVKNERMVEFAFEGKRLTDLIRWVEADKYLAAGMRKGLNANVENPTVEEFNTPMSIPYNYVWARRMYLYPIPQNELYSNPQIVQNPGY